MTDAQPILQFFTWKHLRADLQPASMPFAKLGEEILAPLPRNPERTVTSASSSNRKMRPCAKLFKAE